MYLICTFILVSVVAIIGTLSSSNAAKNVIPGALLATPSPTPAPSPSSGELTPQYSSYRGVTIRMPAAQVADKLGTPTQRSKAGDYFLISADESVQISYDKDQTVKAISINYTGDLKAAPTPKDVVGTEVKKDAEGTITKMVSYPKSGFWISYIRTGGKDATIIITLQKTAIE
jgi:hypothetical protein